MFNNDWIILGPNFLPEVGAPQMFSAPGLAVPKTATGHSQRVKSSDRKDAGLVWSWPSSKISLKNFQWAAV